MSDPQINGRPRGMDFVFHRAGKKAPQYDPPEADKSTGATPDESSLGGPLGGIQRGTAGQAG